MVDRTSLVMVIVVGGTLVGDDPPEPPVPVPTMPLPVAPGGSMPVPLCLGGMTPVPVPEPVPFGGNTPPVLDGRLV